MQRTGLKKNEIQTIRNKINHNEDVNLKKKGFKSLYIKEMQEWIEKNKRTDKVRCSTAH